MICDPEMGGKAVAGRHDDIRTCIACNQACIGHNHLGYSISCIQHPETGRELEFSVLEAAGAPCKILVAGGGPGGMKAAAVAAARGHAVTLYEKATQLGGQALLAQLLPGRTEFGGIVTNLVREMELAGVRVVKDTEVIRVLVEGEGPDAVILATGATPYRPNIEGAEEGHVVDAWSVIRGEANLGGSVARWRSPIGAATGSASVSRRRWRGTAAACASAPTATIRANPSSNTCATSGWANCTG